MIVLLVLILSMVTLVVEYYIYQSLIRRLSRAARIAYIAQALIISLGTAVIMSFYQSMMIYPTFMGISLWAMFIFLISFGIKVILSLTLLVRWALRKIWKKRRFKGVMWTGSMICVAIAALFIYGSSYGRTSIRVERIEIASSKIPAAFDGYRIAQFSDVHLGNYGGATDLIEKLVDAINNENADIVIQSGDLVNIHANELTEKYMKIFAGIKAPVYAVLGNHDLAYYIGDTTKITPNQSINDLRAKQASMGWRLMENEGQWLSRGADSIMLGGVTFPRNHSHNGYNSVVGRSDMAAALSGVTPAHYSILIAHSPSLFDSVSRGQLPDFVISGHVHSMQMKLSIGDWQWSPAKWLYPMFSGLYADYRGRHLYINDGIGYVLYPVRLGTRPELTIFTLRSTK